MSMLRARSRIGKPAQERLMTSSATGYKPPDQFLAYEKDVPLNYCRTSYEATVMAGKNANLALCKAPDEYTDPNYKHLHEKEDEHVEMWEFDYMHQGKAVKVRGLRAKKRFEKDEPIILYAGQYLTEAEKDEEKERQLVNGWKTNYMTEISTSGGNMYIDCFEFGNRGGLANCLNNKNNSILQKVDYEGYVAVAIVADKVIQEGEEILVDYGGDYFDNDDRMVECFCDSSLCSGIIGMPDNSIKEKVSSLKRGITELPDSAIAKYFQFFFSNDNSSVAIEESRAKNYRDDSSVEQEETSVTTDNDNTDTENEESHSDGLSGTAAADGGDEPGSWTSEMPVTLDFFKRVQKWEDDVLAGGPDVENIFKKRIADIGPEDRVLGKRLCLEYLSQQCHDHKIHEKDGAECFRCKQKGLQPHNIRRHYSTCMTDAHHYFYAINPNFKNKAVTDKCLLKTMGKRAAGN